MGAEMIGYLTVGKSCAHRGLCISGAGVIWLGSSNVVELLRMLQVVLAASSCRQIFLTRSDDLGMNAGVKILLE